MRSTVLTLSLMASLFGGLASARADDMDDEPAERPSRFSLAGWFRGRTVDEDEFVDEGVVDDGFAPTGDSFGGEVIEHKPWFTPPDYGAYFQADALWLGRFHSVERPLVVELPGTTPVLSTQDVSLSHQFSPGVLFTAGFNLNQVSAVEFTYFGLNDWSTQNTVTDAAGNLGLAGTLQLATTDFIFSDRFTVSYSSHINNAEANYKQTIEGMTLLAGFRYFNLSEFYDINAHNPMLNESSDYTVNAVNQLIGGQVGLGFNRTWGRLTAGVLGKIGVFANLAHQQTLLQDLGNTFPIRDYRAESTATSVLGEFQLNLSYQVASWFAVHAGYRIIGVSNLALAPGQLDLNNTFPGFKYIDVHEYLFLHGLNVGAEIRW